MSNDLYQQRLMSATGAAGLIPSGARVAMGLGFSQPPAILAALAAEEPGWGGGSTVGGAPRNADGSRSRLDPDAVFERVEAEVQRCLHGGDDRAAGH